MRKSLTSMLLYFLRLQERVAACKLPLGSGPWDVPAPAMCLAECLARWLLAWATDMLWPLYCIEIDNKNIF